MKESPDSRIEDLLSGFVDDELTERQRTLVHRMVRNDPEMAARISTIRKCREVIASLGNEKAPVDMTQRVMATLEVGRIGGLATAQKAPPILEADGVWPKTARITGGGRSLMLRRFVSAAAMIGLVAVLGVVIYAVLAPESRPMRPLVTAARQPAVRMPLPVEAVHHGARQRPPDMVIHARLQLAAPDIIEVGAFIQRVIEGNSMLVMQETQAADISGGGLWHLRASPQALRMLLSDLEGIWDRFDSTRLNIGTDLAGGSVTLANVSPGQVAEVLGQDRLEKSIEAARALAVLDSVNRLVAVIPRQLDPGYSVPSGIPRPALTAGRGRQDRVRRPAAGNHVAFIEFTLVLEPVVGMPRQVE